MRDLVGGLDPQRSYDGRAWELFRCCLLRTLLSFNGRPADEGGTALHPDLAASMPTISDDELTWTFHLRSGLHYGPPFQRTPITAGDIVRALEREATPAVASPYAFYYSIISGFDAYAAGEADSIVGLEAPDATTLVVRLTAPAGDLGYRLALPAAAPIPPSPSDPEAGLGVATGHGDDQGYGPFLVSSGPYMLMGAGSLDFRLAPGEQRPVPGYVAGKSVVLIRNPSAEHDPLRPALSDRIQITLGATRAEIEDRIRRGEVDIDMENVSASPEQQALFQGTPSLVDQLFTAPSAAILYIPMNLAVPPFDELPVRRAVNLVVSHDALTRAATTLPLARGYPPDTAVGISHLVPDTLEGGLLLDYDPYGAVDHLRAVSAARVQMSRSSYDANGDGICDAAACSNVRVIEFAAPVNDGLARQLERDLRKIGITVAVEAYGYRRSIQLGTDVRSRAAMFISLGWTADFPNASTYLLPLLRRPSGTLNRDFSLLGASTSQLRRWGYDLTEVPGIQDRIDECVSLTGTSQVRCWALLDKYLMERVVPWIPVTGETWVYAVSARVKRFVFDAAEDGMPALNRIEVAETHPA